MKNFEKHNNKLFGPISVKMQQTRGRTGPHLRGHQELYLNNSSKNKKESLVRASVKEWLHI